MLLLKWKFLWASCKHSDQAINWLSPSKGFMRCRVDRMDRFYHPQPLPSRWIDHKITSPLKLPSLFLPSNPLCMYKIVWCLLYMFANTVNIHFNGPSDFMRGCIRPSVGRFSAYLERLIHCIRPCLRTPFAIPTCRIALLHFAICRSFPASTGIFRTRRKYQRLLRPGR